MSLNCWDEFYKAHKNVVNVNQIVLCKGSIPCDLVHCCWDGGYFRRWNQKYFPFFKHFLKYCSENNKCKCFWPEENIRALKINTQVFRLLKNLAEQGLILPDFSHYWSAKKIAFNYQQGKHFSHKEYYPDAHGMASSLTTYTFFYSQYQKLLLNIASYIDLNPEPKNSEAMDKIYDLLSVTRDNFLILYNRCLKDHPHPKIYYERGMIRMHSGDIERALEDIKKLMNLARTKKYKDQNLITSEMYQQEGEAYADLGRYDKAIKSLSKAIEKDPNNKDAYFKRAHAYFETGNFDLALSDHLMSEKSKAIDSVKLKPSHELAEGLCRGIYAGFENAAKEFVPSLCYSTYGMDEAAWAKACRLQNDPILSLLSGQFGAPITLFFNEVYELTNSAVKFYKTLSPENIAGYVDEFQAFYEKFDDLKDHDKGEAIGNFIGQHGLDVFASYASIKMLTHYKNLKNVNTLLNFEAMASSETGKKLVTT